MYTEVKSEYIKRKIKTVSRANRSYVDDLIQPHRFIDNRPNGFAANLRFHQSKQQVPGENTVRPPAQCENVIKRPCRKTIMHFA